MNSRSFNLFSDHSSSLKLSRIQKKEEKFFVCVYDLYKTLPHILRLSQRNVVKSVMHVQSCCFTHRICLSLPSKSLSPPWSSCLLKVPLSLLDGIVKKTSSNNNKTINWELPYLATQARLSIGQERVTCRVPKLQEPLV